MLEGIGGIEKLLADVPLERVLFGSHAPSFYFEAAQLKLHESQLSASQRSAITQENARRLLPLA
jgi:predicted TIM-barrel fold metal-dependent hydrolase